MAYVWAGIAVVVLALVAKIVRWWNLPAVAEERRKKTEARQSQRTERAKLKEKRRMERRRKNQRSGL